MSLEMNVTRAFNVEISARKRNTSFWTHRWRSEVDQGRSKWNFSADWLLLECLLYNVPCCYCLWLLGAVGLQFAPVGTVESARELILIWNFSFLIEIIRGLYLLEKLLCSKLKQRYAHLCVNIGICIFLFVIIFCCNFFITSWYKVACIKLM